ncbi:MAG: type II secretion system protein [Planctomycetota bacterium]|jgi:prepilin-type N-terminal cleavage/methylation domain-containing protein
MKNRRYKAGVTLVEMLVVVAIVGLLVAMVVGLGARSENQARVQLARNTIAIVAAALRQFHDYGYTYNPTGDFTQFRFPLDCNDNPDPADRLVETLLDEFQLQPGQVGVVPLGVGPIQHLPEYSGSEGLYFFLSRVPECRTTLERLERIDKSLITALDDDGCGMQLRIGTRVYPLMRIIDPWGTTLIYDYYDETQPEPARYNSRRSFPVIISAGPDRWFGTPDDISSR